MKHRVIWLLALLPVVFTGCTFNTTNTNTGTGTGYKDITPYQAKARLDSEEGIILLDVRTEEEYAQEHIPGSILIPVDELEAQAPVLFTEKGAPIFIYCMSGRRSVSAALILVRLGYIDVYNLGGIIDWPYEKAKGV
ncbi:MAG TPA: rhodanese-like domain-containing protein [Clostridia bacterium]|nr:rhodanese-like domain-containing protein [Clostridia bacterium]